VHSSVGYHVDVYRIGWYGGRGGSLVTCLPARRACAPSSRTRPDGIDVAVMGGNALYWQARYRDDSRRSLVEYRSANEDPDPHQATKTVRWRDVPLNDPECTTLGIEWQGGGSESRKANHYDYVVSSSASPWFKGTGLRPGSRLKGLVDYEWDAVQKGCPHPPKGGVYTSTFLTQDADAVTFTTRSHARVFAAGSNYFA
jgi:hypothetical protein